jgi:hypothetical protein
VPHISQRALCFEAFGLEACSAGYLNVAATPEAVVERRMVIGYPGIKGRKSTFRLLSVAEKVNSVSVAQGHNAHRYGCVLLIG